MSTTPAPWIRGEEHETKVEIFSPAEKRIVATVHREPFYVGRRDRFVGDVDLLLAAPELLAELEHAEWSSDGAACPRCTLYPNHGHAPDCTLAAALKKARGQL